ncbi:MAG: MBL fold metallo-hydrolase [Pseudonocardia sp.]|nr:MBL fold metallo-hydrolase [Pseudonocardia sp.]
MAVNSFLVHGPDGVVVVDGQLTVDDATKVRAAVHASGRRLAAVVITHPHPDHYAGAGLIAGAAPILATPEVADVIERDDQLKAQIVGPMMGEQWPTHRRFPDTLVDPGEVVELAGLRFRAEAGGPGESHADTLWWLDEHTVFAGDLAYNGLHAYLADARYESWLAALAALQSRLVEDATLYVGHGEPAGKPVLAAQRRYIETFLDAVAEHTTDDALARRDRVVARMRSLIPDERLLFLMELSIEPVHAALREHRS